MIRFWLTMIGFTPFLLIGGSQKRAVPLAPVPSIALHIDAHPIPNPIVKTELPFAFVKAWTLSSPNRDFGSVSALLRDSNGFTAISDHGAVVRFKLSADNAVFDASLAPLPRGCAADELKTSRDVESVSRDPRTGEVLFGFEWSNMICRSDMKLRAALRVSHPALMRNWPILNGAEALVTLSDGRMLIFAENSQSEGATSPLLIFEGDPTRRGARATELSYRPPAGFRPTDAVQLPDGRLAIINRRYQFPLNFSAVITTVKLNDIKPGAIVSGTIAAWLDQPSIAENYEAITVSQNGARTFVWLMSDDNFIALQSTNLVLFEVVSPKSLSAKTN